MTMWQARFAFAALVAFCVASDWWINDLGKHCCRSEDEAGMVVSIGSADEGCGSGFWGGLCQALNDD